MALRPPALPPFIPQGPLQLLEVPLAVLADPAGIPATPPTEEWSCSIRSAGHPQIDAKRQREQPAEYLPEERHRTASAPAPHSVPTHSR